MNILIADDDRLILFALSTRLHRDGYAVTTFRSGEELVAELGENPHATDAVITDFSMGIDKLNGLDVLKRIRDILPDMPVIVHSASLEIREEVGAAGAVFVEKNDYAALIEALSRIKT